MSRSTHFSTNSEAMQNWPTKEVRQCYVPQSLCSIDITPKCIFHTTL